MSDDLAIAQARLAMWETVGDMITQAVADGYSGGMVTRRMVNAVNLAKSPMFVSRRGEVEIGSPEQSGHRGG